ncbi:hypothetical protein G9A89_005698 [Geosiphon pyriformis]|nr:hypothetical protein G9A89_005698 [Geosiphon pyriformis]
MNNNKKKKRKPDHFDRTNFRRKVENLDLLYKFAKFASYSKRASCLIGHENRMAEGIYAFAESHDQEVTIAIKGTKYDFQKWMNRKNVLIEYPGNFDHVKPRVDLTFYDDYVKSRHNLIELVKTELSRHIKSFPRISLVGHGLGGVYAIFLALELQESKIMNPLNVFTFGQPRIGDVAFADYVNKKLFIFRITLEGDYVPVIPFRTDPGRGYLHHRNEFFIDVPCDCNQESVVYECRGFKNPEYGYFDEPPYCINACELNVDQRIKIHNGPYFGQMMGQCQDD